MTFSPHSAGDSSFRDPYQIDRLADELASREASAAYNTESQLYNEPVPEFQEPVPLSHNEPHLSADSFDAEEFLLERRKIALPDLRAELRQYLAELKEELVKLINDDYEAFISLSTDLRDEGARLERLRHPLGTLKANVLESKKDLEIIQGAIHEKLSSRSKLREEQALLHLLSKISDSVIRLEKLLVILSPEQDLQGPDDVGTVLMHNSQLEENADADDKLRGNRAKHLARVATEYTQLLYHVRKARAEKCIFVNELQWRIDRLQSTLSSDLDQLFAQTLVSLTDARVDHKGTELEKNKRISDLTECLRIYDVLGLWRDAEDVIRREVMRPFIQKTIHPGALAAPPSPIVPNTPFRIVGPGPISSVSSTHQIPYTPFTACTPRRNTYNIESLPDAPRAHLLDETDDSLARLYNQLLRFIERDLCRIMGLADEIAVATHKEWTAKRDDILMEVGKSAEEARGFQIMSRVVWEELGQSLMDEIGVIVFAAGSPKEFRQHYETTQAFIRSLELLAPSRHAVEQMRQHSVYTSFDRRWQLPVYFQLRWKEIIGTLEDTLTSTRLESINPKGDGSFATPQAAAVWIALSGCWSSEIYLPALGHRFWRLTLQILSRYMTWLEETLSAVESSSKGSSTDKPAISPNSTRAGTPVLPETPLAESIAADDVSLRQYAAASIDIKLMETNTWRLWHQVISMMLPDTPEDSSQAEEAIREILSSLKAYIENISVKIVAILTKRCYDNLLPVRSIPTQLRMANKRTPTEPSSFVPSILRPLKQFFDGPGIYLKDGYFQRYSTEVFNHVTQRYISYLTAIKKAEEPLKRLKKKTRPTFSLFGTSPNVNDDAKDEERIRSQMILDVESFGKDARTLGVDADSDPYFASLKEIVYATDPE